MFFLMANLTKKLHAFQMLFFTSNNAFAVFIIGFVMYLEVVSLPASGTSEVIPQTNKPFNLVPVAAIPQHRPIFRRSPPLVFQSRHLRKCFHMDYRQWGTLHFLLIQ